MEGACKRSRPADLRKRGTESDACGLCIAQTQGNPAGGAGGMCCCIRETTAGLSRRQIAREGGAAARRSAALSREWSSPGSARWATAKPPSEVDARWSGRILPPEWIREPTDGPGRGKAREMVAAMKHRRVKMAGAPAGVRPCRQSTSGLSASSLARGAPSDGKCAASTAWICPSASSTGRWRRPGRNRA